MRYMADSISAGMGWLWVHAVSVEIRIQVYLILRTVKLSNWAKKKICASRTRKHTRSAGVLCKYLQCQQHTLHGGGTCFKGWQGNHPYWLMYITSAQDLTLCNFQHIEQTSVQVLCMVSTSPSPQYLICTLHHLSCLDVNIWLLCTLHTVIHLVLKT